MFWSEKCSEAGVIEVKQEREISIEDTGDFRPRQPQPSKLFITPHSVLVCCTSRDVTPIIATQFVQKVCYQNVSCKTKVAHNLADFIQN